MRQRPYSATYISSTKQNIPALFAAYNTRAQLLQKWQDSLACLVSVLRWQGCEENPPVFTTLVKMTSPATESGRVWIRKFSVRLSLWMLARDPRLPQNCNLGLPVRKVCSVGFSPGRPPYTRVFPSPEHGACCSALRRQSVLNTNIFQ